MVDVVISPDWVVCSKCGVHMPKDEFEDHDCYGWVSGRVVKISSDGRVGIPQPEYFRRLGD